MQGLTTLVAGMCLALTLSQGAIADGAGGPAPAGPAAQAAAAPAAQSPSVPGDAATVQAQVQVSAEAEGAARPAVTDPAAAPAAPEVKVAAAAEDPVICRTETETNTFGRRNKICMTRSQWEEHRRAARGFMRNISRGSAAQGVEGN